MDRHRLIEELRKELLRENQMDLITMFEIEACTEDEILAKDYYARSLPEQIVRRIIATAKDVKDYEKLLREAYDEREKKRWSRPFRERD